MSREEVHIDNTYDATALAKGLYLVLLQADRIPPHIGLLIDGAYHSLTVKGHELNIASSVLLKNISLRKIPSLFIKIKKHPVFSNNHLNETFIEQIKLFDKVNTDENTCLSPIRLFFQEFYAIDKNNIHLVFDLLDQLYENNFIENSCGTNIGELKQNIFYLQTYNQSQLKIRIAEEMIKNKL